MSDTFSAPVNDASRKWLALKADDLAAIIKIDLAKPCDSIVVHHLAESLEGLTRNFRMVVEKSIDDYWVNIDRDRIDGGES